MTDIKEEELLEEIVTLLMAALNIAGVKEHKMQEALDAYEEAINKEDDSKAYDYKVVSSVILNLKNTHKELFK
ncbi:MAG: hypothetical protein K2P17_00860 [Helicobacteraceae bacterium]|nr:hypothetical protein [Helicobacteraceae bacterium]